VYTAIKDIFFNSYLITVHVSLLNFSIIEGLGNSGYLLTFFGSELRSVFYKFTYITAYTELLDVIHMHDNHPLTAPCQHLHTWE
jgi:hypothetical protein